MGVFDPHLPANRNMAQHAVEGDNSRLSTFARPESVDREAYTSVVSDYASMFEANPQDASSVDPSDPAEGEAIAQRKANYSDMTNNFYDIVTNFYEYGWGQSFH